MKKRFIVFLVVFVAAISCACGNVEALLKNNGQALSKNIDSTDGKFTIKVPKEWEINSAASADYLLFALKGDSEGANVFFYENSEDGLTLDDYIQQIQIYYGENIKGEIQTTKVNENDAKYFEYSMVDLGDDDKEYNFHGYEYFINFADGVAEIDIYVTQTKIEEKLFSPSKEQLEKLRNISQTFALKK